MENHRMGLGIWRILLAIVAMYGLSSAATAQMGMGGGMGGFPGLYFSAHTIAVHAPGGSYTPFERLRHETRTVRTHAFPEQKATGQTAEVHAETEKQATAPDKLDTEYVETNETAFRCRRSLVHPQPSLAAATKTYQPIRHATVNERRIREALNAAAWKMDFVESPLRDIVAEIREKAGIEVQIDMKAFEDSGMDLDVPVTQSVENVSLKSAIRLIFDSLDLTYLVVNETLLITTKDRAAEHLAVVLYPIPWGHTCASVVELVQGTVAPHTWSTIGGSGYAFPAGSFLVVSQTEDVHDQLGDLLETVFEAEFKAPTDQGATTPPRIITRMYPVGDEQVLSELAAKLSELCNTALGPDADPQAKIFPVGGKLVVQSASRPFHVYAAQVIDGMNGVEVSSVEWFEHHPANRFIGGQGVIGGQGGAGTF